MTEMLEARCLLSTTFTSQLVGDFTTANQGPNGPLVFQGGNLFGVSSNGGGDGGIGTVFEVPLLTPGPIATVVSLGERGAATPLGGLISDGAGNLYGVSQGGGDGSGAIFSATVGGGFSLLGAFDGTGIDNDANPSGPLIIVNGKLFGTSEDGGANNAGEVFSIPVGGGNITDVVPFPAPGGQPSHVNPGLVTDGSGNLYGILTQTGTNGSVFEVTGASLTTVASFAAGNNAFVSGTQEESPIVMSNGNLFGINAGGMFEVPAGAHTVTQLGTYSGLTGQPSSSLIMDGSGNIFGTTTLGAFEWDGTAHSFSMIATLPSSVNGLPDGVAFGDSGDIFVTDGGGGSSGVGGVYELIPGASVAPTSTLTPAISGALPASVIAGQKAKISETVTITASAAYNATSSTELFLSTGTTIDGSSIELPGKLTKSLKLKAGAHTAVKFSLKSVPTSVANGTYHVIAQVTDNNGVTSAAASSDTITVAPAQIDLAGAILKVLSTGKGAKKFTPTLRVTNNGNTAAVGTLAVEVETSPDGLAGDATPIVTDNKGINIKPGKSVTIPAGFVAPASGTSSFLIFVIDPANQFSDIDLTNNLVVSPTAVAFS
jgi:uncharacterized repeat protein (TIGR03803 family)